MDAFMDPTDPLMVEFASMIEANKTRIAKEASEKRIKAIHEVACKGKPACDCPRYNEVGYCNC